MGAVGPTPEIQRQWGQLGGINGCRRISGVGCEEIGLMAAALLASKQWSLMLMQQRLPSAELLGIEGKLWRGRGRRCSR